MELKSTTFCVGAPDPTRAPEVGGAGVIVRLNGTEWVNPPEVAVIVTGNDPTGAALATDRVSTLALAAGFGLNVAVTPAGRPEAAMPTAPLNPNTGIKAMLLVPLVP